jgi:alpha-mannosidase
MRSLSHYVALVTVNISPRCEDHKPHEPQCSISSKFLWTKYFSQHPLKNKRSEVFSVSNIIDPVLPRQNKRQIIIIGSLIKLFLLRPVRQIGNASERPFFLSCNICSSYSERANISLLSNYNEILLI